MADEEMTNAEIGRSLIRIETKLDNATGDHENRIRALERWIWGAAGAGGLGAFSGLLSLFGHLH